MGEGSSPNAVGLARFGGIFEAVVSEGTATAEFFGEKDGLFSLSPVGDIFGEEEDGRYCAGYGFRVD